MWCFGVIFVHIHMYKRDLIVIVIFVLAGKQSNLQGLHSLLLLAQTILKVLCGSNSNWDLKLSADA